MKFFDKITLVVWIALLICSGATFGEVVFSEDFSTDLSSWILLDTPSEEGSVSITLSGGKLDISMTNNDRWRAQGLQSIERFALPFGGKLVIDFYGTNEGSAHSYPFWTVSSVDESSVGVLETWVPSGWFSVKGWDASYGDWVQWGGMLDGYADLPGANATTPKHVIMEIDSLFINVYIEDDYYRNLSSPVAVYTVDTSSVYTPQELLQGLYIDILAARYTSWWEGPFAEVNEKFDGVEVSYIEGVPVEPADCDEVIWRGYKIKGDINDDCKVDMLDLTEIVQVWLDSVSP